MIGGPLQSPRFKGPGKRARLALFFVAYFMFLLPVFIALIREFAAPDKKRGSALVLPIMHPGGPAFLSALAKWLGTQLVLYPVFRVVGRRIGIKLHEKTTGKHKDDILRLVYFSIALAAVGGVSIRIEEGVVNYETGLTFIPLTLMYVFFFTCVFELVKDRDISLSMGLLENKLGLFVVSIGFVTVLAVGVSLYLTAWQVGPEFFTLYTGVSLAVLGVHFLMFLPWIPGVPGRSHLHIHHWYWPVPLMHMCVFHTDTSMLAQAIFLAVHIHGVDCFGVEPLFYDSERRARHPSDFDWVLKEHAHEPRPYDTKYQAGVDFDAPSTPATPDIEQDEVTGLILRELRGTEQQQGSPVDA